MNLETVKKHMRVTYDFDDEIILEYLEWAEEEVKNSISTSDTRHEDYFKDNPTFDRAVALLVTHYYENRKPTTDKITYNLIFGVKNALFKLKLGYNQKYGDYHEL